MLRRLEEFGTLKNLSVREARVECVKTERVNGIIDSDIHAAWLERMVENQNPLANIVDGRGAGKTPRASV